MIVITNVLIVFLTVVLENQNCCLLHPEEWEGCNRSKNGLCKVGTRQS